MSAPPEPQLATGIQPGLQAGLAGDSLAAQYAYAQQQPIDAGAEQGLAALRDSPAGTKPFYPYSTLIRYAIKGAPGQKLLLEDIYYAIEARFPYFRSAPSGWKNSVRHNLSLNPCFEKIPRPLTDRGKGSYWTVNDNVDPRTGVHRVRKKKGSQRGSTAGNEVQDRSAAAANGAYLPAYVDENGIPRFAAGQPSVYYDPNNPDVPLVASDGMRYPEGDEGDLEPEVDEQGNPHWRSIWLNELARLQQVTHAQDSAGADQEWYKMMVMRVRSAFLVPPPAAGYVEQAAADQQQAADAAQAPEGTDPAMA